MGEKRQLILLQGESYYLLKHFQKKLRENRTFYYAYQIDIEYEITYVFWIDV